MEVNVDLFDPLSVMAWFKQLYRLTQKEDPPLIFVERVAAEVGRNECVVSLLVEGGEGETQ